MDYLLTLYTKVLTIGKINPMMSSAITVYLLGVITYMLRNTPLKIYHFLKRQLITTMTLETSSWDDRELFNAFTQWYLKVKADNTAVRSYMLSTGDNAKDVVFGAGYGYHWFFFNYRFYWFKLTRIEGQGMNNLKYQVALSYLGRNRQVLERLIDNFKPKDTDGIFSTAWYKDDWGYKTTVLERSLDTVIIPKETKYRIVKVIEDFKNNRDWYVTRGIPYKLVIILYGPPGTGKTSLIRALATRFKLNIKRLNLSHLSDIGLEKALAYRSDDMMVVVEDFDSCKSLHARNKNPSVQKTKPTETHDHLTDTPTLSVNDLADSLEVLTLSGFLNAIDGVVPLDGTVIIMTTNTLDDIDPAVTRAGRVDYMFELGPLEHDEIVEYILKMYELETCPELQGVHFKPVTGSELYGHFKENSSNYHDFIKVLPKD